MATVADIIGYLESRELGNLEVPPVLSAVVERFGGEAVEFALQGLISWVYMSAIQRLSESTNIDKSKNSATTRDVISTVLDSSPGLAHLVWLDGGRLALRTTLNQAELDAARSQIQAYILPRVHVRLRDRTESDAGQ